MSVPPRRVVATFRRLSLRHAPAPISLAARPRKMPPRPRWAQCWCSAIRSVFYVNYAGCYPACGFLICYLRFFLLAFFVLIDPVFGEKLTFFSNFGTIICIFQKNVVLLQPSFRKEMTDILNKMRLTRFVLASRNLVNSQSSKALQHKMLMVCIIICARICV